MCYKLKHDKLPANHVILLFSSLWFCSMKKMKFKHLKSQGNAIENYLFICLFIPSSQFFSLTKNYSLNNFGNTLF